MKITILEDGIVEPQKWPKKAGDIVDINPRDVQRNIDSGLAELYQPPPPDNVTLEIQNGAHNITTRIPHTTDGDPPDATADVKAEVPEETPETIKAALEKING